MAALETFGFWALHGHTRSACIDRIGQRRVMLSGQTHMRALRNTSGPRAAGPDLSRRASTEGPHERPEDLPRKRAAGPLPTRGRAGPGRFPGQNFCAIKEDVAKKSSP